MKVLALASYPVEAPATRFRLAQFAEPLRERGIDLTISPFLSSEQFKAHYDTRGIGIKALSLIPSVLRRLGESLSAGKYDAVIVQREAMFFGPAIFEWLTQQIGRRPMILDLDDATYVSYQSPSYGRIGSSLKFFGKTDRLIDRSDLVICGNRFIAEYCDKRGATTAVIPTIADPDVFKPAPKDNEVPVVGWIGTHSTFPFLEQILPVIDRLGQKHDFALKVVGARRDDIALDNVDIINKDWSLEDEVEDFQSLDIGLYPITVSDTASEAWLQGKSGFKAIQYLAVGVPFVMSPVGVCAEIGEPRITHFNAISDDEWYEALDGLLGDPELRKKMGDAGRQYSIEHYGVSSHAERLAQLIEGVGSSVVKK